MTAKTKFGPHYCRQDYPTIKKLAKEDVKPAKPHDGLMEDSLKG
jgi:hypothetical protein